MFWNINLTVWVIQYRHYTYQFNSVFRCQFIFIRWNQRSALSFENWNYSQHSIQCQKPSTLSLFTRLLQEFNGLSVIPFPRNKIHIKHDWIGHIWELNRFFLWLWNKDTSRELNQWFQKENGNSLHGIMESLPFQFVTLIHFLLGFVRKH